MNMPVENIFSLHLPKEIMSTKNILQNKFLKLNVAIFSSLMIISFGLQKMAAPPASPETKKDLTAQIKNNNQPRLMVSSDRLRRNFAVTR